jgi:hypothetical protein
MTAVLFIASAFGNAMGCDEHKLNWDGEASMASKSLAALLRLMHYRHFRGRTGPEDKLAIEIATMLRVATLEGRLLASWTHLPNEMCGGGKLAAIRLALAKSMGLIAGSADYVFCWPTGSCWIEIKAKDGSLSPAQRDFREWNEGLGVNYFVVRSVEDFEAKLISLGVLRVGPK